MGMFRTCVCYMKPAETVSNRTASLTKMAHPFTRLIVKMTIRNLLQKNKEVVDSTVSNVFPPLKD